MLKVGVVIPTLNAEKELLSLLPKVLEAFPKEHILVIDSSSKDTTCAVANSFGVQLKVIKAQAFNHGLTRELGRKLLGGDIVIYLTQDALPTHKEVFYHIIDPIIKQKASLSYGRQIPKKEAHPFEKCLREFNYGEKGEIRSLNDFQKEGSSIYFCSNTFAAYSNVALDQIGGFSKVSFGEDALAAAEILNNGGSIAYVPEASVIHSHQHSFLNQFKRDRAFGKERRLHFKLFRGGEMKKGVSFAKKLFKETHPFYWPQLFFYLALRGFAFFTAFL
jgi:rhamnosyltransferase